MMMPRLAAAAAALLTVASPLHASPSEEFKNYPHPAPGSEALSLTPGASATDGEQSPPRVAFLGDSITYDGRWALRVEAALRATPQYANAEIVNFGLPSENLSGLSEPNHADGKFPRPCLKTRLASVLEKFHPTLIIAAYGMNDGIYLPADPGRLQAYQAGLADLDQRATAAGARIVWVTPSPFQADHPETDSAHYDAVLDSLSSELLSHRRRDGWQIIDVRPAVRKSIAASRKKDAAFTFAADGVHPGEEGHRFMADAILAQLWPLLKLPGKPAVKDDVSLPKLGERATLLKHAWLSYTGYERPGIPAGVPMDQAGPAAATLFADYQALASAKHSDWHGGDRIDFTSCGREAIVVVPKQPAPGNPWIWRTEFFDHEPQADIALLNQGYHVAFVNVFGLWGSPQALDHMDDFFGILTRCYHLSDKPVLEGFSRGGFYALNWAARNPSQVGALYLDAPLCDFKSAPYGRHGEKEPGDWQQLLEAWGMTEEQALAYDRNPVDNLAPLAQSQIPILSVVGDADDVVPYVENTGLVESRYQALGAHIEVIHKPGVGHHPHSLPNPAPIVDFILRTNKATH